MKEVSFKVLIDNQTFSDLESEHGLSILIETEEICILCDMGASSAFLRNAERMGVDINTIDFAFISHGHSDHTGGLRSFLERYPNKKIFASKNIFNEYYFSGRRGYRRAMSTDHSLLNDYGDVFQLIDNQQNVGGSNGIWISPKVAIVSNIHHKWSTPFGNKYLTKMISSEGNSPLQPDPEYLLSDDFGHELSLVILTESGAVIFSSCSHCGAVNIIESCCDFTGESRVRAFVGGLHLVDSPEVVSEIDNFASELSKRFPETHIFTGHCTSDSAKELLLKKLNCVELFYAGCSIVL